MLLLFRREIYKLLKNLVLDDLNTIISKWNINYLMFKSFPFQPLLSLLRLGPKL